MRMPLAVASLVLSGAAAAAGDGGSWCYRDFGGPQYTNCSFYSARECMVAAGAMGGVPGSPTPVGFSPPGPRCTSTRGISFIRSTG